jgi:hypothetical protein
LTPCDVVARVAPIPYQSPDDDYEVDVARCLTATGSPIGELEPRVDPRVYVRYGFHITFWTYYEPLPPPQIGASEYSEALARLHTGLRQIEVKAPHLTERIADNQRAVADPVATPKLRDVDRELLFNTLSRLGPRLIGLPGEQLLHGEPHLGNVLRTDKGLLFIDLGGCCRGPVEYDIAYALLPSSEGRPALAAHDLCEHYPGADPDVLDECRILIWALITTYRWIPGDELPNGRFWAVEGLSQLRALFAGRGGDVG